MVENLNQVILDYNFFSVGKKLGQFVVNLFNRPGNADG
jgi:hypothetical protein